jgi:hypothetical protein
MEWIQSATFPVDYLQVVQLFRILTYDTIEREVDDEERN